MMESHQASIDRDDVIAREVNLELVAGKPDIAIQLMRSRFFHSWEGGGTFSLGDAWINANLERGHNHMIAKQYAEALSDFQAALQIPANLLDAAGETGGRRAEIAYWIGNAYQAMGEVEQARHFWTDASVSPTSDGRGSDDKPLAYGQFSGRSSVGGLAPGGHVIRADIYYQALSMAKLGRNEEARTLFQQLRDTGMKSLTGERENLPGASLSQRSQIADAHYIAGLGQLGLKDKDKARQQFTLALKAIPDHLAAKNALLDIGL